MFRTQVIRQKVSLKIIGFSMEMPCWSSSEGLQHGDRKPVETPQREDSDLSVAWELQGPWKEGRGLQPLKAWKLGPQRED